MVKTTKTSNTTAGIYLAGFFAGRFSALPVGWTNREHFEFFVAACVWSGGRHAAIFLYKE